jgi:hypothetical protein
MREPVQARWCALQAVTLATCSPAVRRAAQALLEVL